MRAASALEMENGRFTAIYPDERVTLEPNVVRVSP